MNCSQKNPKTDIGASVKKKVVIVGFPGIGMTELTKRQKEYVEVETSASGVSTDVIKNLLDEGLKVLIPFDKDICDALVKEKIKFVIVYPSRSLKADICSRISPRSIDDTRITDLINHWDEHIDQCSTQECYTQVVLTKSNSYLCDLVVYIENLFTNCK